MSRSQIYQANQPKSKRIGPMWRGIGCVMLLALTLGAYWLGGVLLKAYREKPFTSVRIPADWGFTIGPIVVPVGIAPADPTGQGGGVTVGPVTLKPGTIKFFVSWMQLAMTAVVDIVIYGVLIVIYSRANPIKLGPTDAPPVYPKKGRKKNLTR